MRDIEDGRWKMEDGPHLPSPNSHLPLIQKLPGSTLLRAIGNKEMSAMRLAQLYYRKYSLVGFYDDLAHYLEHGFVIARPSCFAMFTVIDLAPEGAAQTELAWFVRIAVGKLDELIRCIPCYLPRIAFCRRNDGTMRVYPLKSLLKTAIKMKRGT